MSKKVYNLAEISEVLHISPDTIYKWEGYFPVLSPSRIGGVRRYTLWQLELLKAIKRYFYSFNQDIPRTSRAIEAWLKEHPER